MIITVTAQPDDEIMYSNTENTGINVSIQTVKAFNKYFPTV
jgi:hypothetical protein